jgi:XisI protein
MKVMVSFALKLVSQIARAVSGSTVVHVDIKEDKIWIQYDGTEYSVAQELIDLGVSPQSIVIAYHSPSARKFTEFAVG